MTLAQLSDRSCCSPSTQRLLPLSEAERSRLSSEIWRIAEKWMEQTKHMQTQSHAAFSNDLAECTSASGAAELCGTWMGHHLDSLMATQHQILEVWLKALTEKDGGVQP